MGREACCRHDIAYLVSWRRVTHLQRSLLWGNASRFESSRPKIRKTQILRNRVYVGFRRLFRLSHRTCDPSSKWPVRGPARRGQTVGEPGYAYARRVGRGGEHLGRRSAVGGRRSAAGRRRSACGIALVCLVQFQPIFSFRTRNIDKNRPPWRNKGVEAERYTKVHFSE